MTAPGWYDDPQAPGGLRWWDGSSWSEHTAPGPGSAPGVSNRGAAYGWPQHGGGADTGGAGYGDIGIWITTSLKAALTRFAQVLLLTLPLIAVAAVAFVIGWSVLDGKGEYRNMTDALAGGSEDLSEAQIDAIVRFLIMLAKAVLPAVLAVGALAPLYTATIAHQLSEALRGRKAALGESFTWGRSRYVPVLVSFVTLGGLVVAGVGVMAVAVVLLVAVSSLLFPLIFVAFGALIYTQVRLSLAVAVAAGTRSPTPVRDAWRAVEGRWLSTLGRVLLFGLCTGAVNFGASIATQTISVIAGIAGGPVFAVVVAIACSAVSYLYIAAADLASKLAMTHDLLGNDTLETGTGHSSGNIPGL